MEVGGWQGVGVVVGGQGGAAAGGSLQQQEGQGVVEVLGGLVVGLDGEGEGAVRGVCWAEGGGDAAWSLLLRNAQASEGSEVSDAWLSAVDGS